MSVAAAATAAALPSMWALRHVGSAAVRTWTPPMLHGQRVGPLYARVGGAGDGATVLLHGLVATGDVFGGAYEGLAATRRLVIPDLLGFGRSLDTTRSAFSVDDHLDALDQLADRNGLLDRRWCIGAHSMGSVLALRWAARHPERVDRVVCWGAPLYASSAAATAEISGSVMTRLFVLDTRWAERACAASCRHRTAAGWMAAVLEPSLPVPIARAVSHHTWLAYRDAMRHLVIDTPWRRLLTDLDRNGTPVELVWGSRDRVGDVDHARAVADRLDHATVRLVEGADHRLPMTGPGTCLSQLCGAISDPWVA